MRLFVRYTVIAIILSYVALRVITHPTSIQREPDNEKHAYFQNSSGEPLRADVQSINFYREDEVIVYNAAWNRTVSYIVECELSHKMALDCESVVHYGLARFEANDRFVFHWDE